MYKLTVGQLCVQHDQVYIYAYIKNALCTAKSYLYKEHFMYTKSYFANARLTSYRYVITTFICHPTYEAYSERSNSSRIF